MKLVNNSVTYYSQEPGLEGMYKAIQKAAWVCYQTEKSKLTPKEFTEQILLPKGHTRPLEFGTVYLTIPFNFTDHYRELTARLTGFFSNNPYTRCATDGKNLYVTTNFRVIMEGFSTDGKTAIKTNYKDNLIDDMNTYWSEPTTLHPRRHTVYITTSRGICDEFKTHSTISSLMESTRYCNYSAGKFGNEVTFIKPTGALADDTLEAYAQAEKHYLSLISKGVQPQFARDAHPTADEISTICKLLIQNTHQKKNPYGVDPSVFIL